ncbi:hypothetical protein NLG97_g6968 [Lecanicillium saksenae]|uniref:Uncharacterized protein n=1 Tax=Lecanicillium saksenae TaxID=468837 RepID=A0ACC1QPZ5_9HYPO|nr:hypothetical protein NLG97_g6968 [Lecanicillium saksenae]
MLLPFFLSSPSLPSLSPSLSLHSANEEITGHGSFVLISNPQCWQDGDHALADVSYGQGPVGYQQYKKTFWDAFIAMGHETGCELNVNL